MTHLALLAASLLFAAAPLAGQERYRAVVDRILAAWRTADVVCLGEDHGRLYDSELRIALVRHRDFPKTEQILMDGIRRLDHDRAHGAPFTTSTSVFRARNAFA
jgi:hypothetical protein